MEQHINPVQIRIHATRTSQSIVSSDEQRLSALGIRTRDLARSGVANVVLRRGVAIRTEEQEIRSSSIADQARCFDQGSIGCVVGEDLDRVADRSHAVGLDFLQHDGCGHNGVDRVAAGAAVAETVAVDFVHDVEGAVAFAEAGGVDCAALGERTGEGGGVGGVRACDGGAGCGAHAVVAGVCTVCGGKVHDEGSVVLGLD